MLSTDQDVNINLVLPLSITLKDLCKSDSGDNKLLNYLKNKFSFIIEKYFKINTIHQFATILTPAYKNLVFYNNIQRRNVYTELRKNINCYNFKLKSPAKFNSTGNVITDSLLNYQRPMNLLKDNEFKDELTLCLADDDIYSPPLTYWNKNNVIMPELSNLAMGLLAIPASTTPVERCYSTSGYIMGIRRTTLTFDSLMKNSFIKFNYDNII
jgi:hypothetical protein